MLRSFVLAILLAAGATAAPAQTVSDRIAETGLAATETALAAAPDPDPDTRLALAALRFLRGIEKSLQTRYRFNAQTADVGIPILRLPIPENLDPDPFDPGLITALFTELRQDMDAARAALDAIPPQAEVSLELTLSDLWFDANLNGIRDPREGVFDIAGSTLIGGFGRTAAPDGPTVRFDTADADWLAAYTHLLSGIADLVVAFDPTDVIAEVLASRAAMADIAGPRPPDRFSYLRSESEFVDMFAMVYGAVNRRPDAALTRSARDQFLQMIARNRAFWHRVAQETDNDREWIPNPRQQAALGFDLPSDTAEVWQAVLADAEALLNGTLLAGHWRTEPGGGVNVMKLMTDPPAVDIVTWVQGHGLLPYMEPGPLVSDDNLTRFERMISGDALLFMVLLN